MPIDMRRPVAAALRAALDEALPQQSPPPQKTTHHLGAGRALLVGAGLVTAGRLAAGSRGRALLEQLSQGVGGKGSSQEDRYDDEEDFDDEEEFDKPAAQGDEDEEEDVDNEDFDDEDEFDEPAAQGDEDDEPEGRGEEDDEEDDEEGFGDDEDDEVERPRRRSSGPPARSRPKAGGRSRR